jgi:S1-C subfamily serine protease
MLKTGKDVLFVQIDAATSPGNSGGPVFMGDQVISVVDWGDAQDGSENLNFSIHYSEVMEFLKRHDVAYHKGD